MTGEESKPQCPAIPDHWSQYLRCTICFSYLREPHTLPCGHTFCKRCLQQLADIARDDNPDVRPKHLKLSCPACRQVFSAKPVLTGTISTCIVLKQLVELWRAECAMLATSSVLAVRSICTQTKPSPKKLNLDKSLFDPNKTPCTEVVNNDNEKHDNGGTVAGTMVEASGEGGANDKEVGDRKLAVDDDNVSDEGSGSEEDLHEEFTVRMRPLDQYCQAVMQRVSESTEDLEFDLQNDALFSKGSAPDPSTVLAQHLAVAIISPRHLRHQHRQINLLGEGGDSSSDSDGSSLSSISHRPRRGRGNGSMQDVSSLSSISIPDLASHIGFLPRLLDVPSARLLLLLAWCSYSVLIVGLAQPFLPYIIMFTLFFFLVLLR